MLVTQSHLTLCNPMHCSPPGSSLVEFSRQEYWSGLLFPTPGNLPNPGDGNGYPLQYYYLLNYLNKCFSIYLIFNLILLLKKDTHSP